MILLLFKSVLKDIASLIEVISTGVNSEEEANIKHDLPKWQVDQSKEDVVQEQENNSDELGRRLDFPWHLRSKDNPILFNQQET